MFVRGMVQHQIEHDLHLSGVHLLHQLFKKRHVSILPGNGKVVADIVSKIPLGALRKGRNPDRFIAEILEVIEFLDNPLNVADAIPVCIVERAQVDMVNSGSLPPVRICMGGQGGIRSVRQRWHVTHQVLQRAGRGRVGWRSSGTPQPRTRRRSSLQHDTSLFE